MTTHISISFRRFEKCPISGERREIVGHVPAFFSSYSGSHHFRAFAVGLLPEKVLRDLDFGSTMGSICDGEDTTIWEAK